MAGPFEKIAPMLVPADPLLQAIGEGSELYFDVARQQLMILTGTKETIVRTIEGEYPKYRQLDVTPVHKIRISRRAAIDVLKRTAVAARMVDDVTPVTISSAPDRSSGFRFRVKDRSVEHVSGVGSLPFEIAFNPGFLRAGIEACTGGTVEMWFVDQLKPAKIVDGTYGYLIVPVRQS
jgi:DNA polymerase-3 subunit beta